MLTIPDEICQERNQSDMDHPILSQASCTAIQVGLVDLLASWNVRPTRVVGHSSGEIAAAYCAGRVSRKVAWGLAYLRGYAVAKQLHKKGAMMAVGLSPDAIQPYLAKIRKEHHGDLVIACYNSSENITLSGDEDLIDKLQTLLQNDSIFARKLAVKNAYHSPHMNDAGSDYLELIKKYNLEIPEIIKTDVIMISSCTGKLLSPGDVLKDHYWVQNLVSPVRFSEALYNLVSLNGDDSLTSTSKEDTRSRCIDSIVEIGPHSALRSAIRDTLSTSSSRSSVEYYAAMIRGAEDEMSILSAVASLHCRGFPVAVDLVNSAESAPSTLGRMLTDLPYYSFNHSQTYWAESKASKRLRKRGMSSFSNFSSM